MSRSTGIQAEIQQRKPFRSPAEELVAALLRTTDLLRRLLAERIEAQGIKVQQYNVLRILRGAGRKGIPTLDIGERMIERAPGVTRLIDRLERKGLARRERSTDDRRQVLCHITPAGRKLLDRLESPVADAEEQFAKSLGKKGLAELNRLLETLRRGRA